MKFLWSLISVVVCMPAPSRGGQKYVADGALFDELLQIGGLFSKCSKKNSCIAMLYMYVREEVLFILVPFSSQIMNMYFCMDFAIFVVQAKETPHTCIFDSWILEHSVER